MKRLLIFIGLISFLQSNAQILTREDSLNAGLEMSQKSVIISGYGEVMVSYDKNFKTATANLTRTVLFFGYKLKNNITLLSEFELEDALVSANGGEFAIEQCVLKFDLNRNHYLLAGLLIPRIGIINENHLPTTFNSNDRPQTETLIIPATWREIGVAYYGSSDYIPGLNWSFALLNGLNGEGINGNNGIRDARFEGSNATASNIAVTASVLHYYKGFRLQASGYYGGSVGLTPLAADSLQLNSGPFGTPVALGEVNAQFNKNGFKIKALASYVSIPEASSLNRAYASNAPETMYGYYGEVSYNVLHGLTKKNRQLDLFVRYESMDIMASVPDNGIKDDINNKQFLYAGLTYLPVRNVAIKFDWKHLSTGNPNPALILDVAPNAPEYIPTNDFFQLGLAYNF